MTRTTIGSIVVLSMFAVASQAQTAACSKMSTGQNSSLNGFIPFPVTDPWRQVVTNATVDGNSDAIIATIGATVPLHPDFGSGTYGGGTIGIPYQVVSGQAVAPVTYNAYGDESDSGPMPIPSNVLIEGYPSVPNGGDQHALVLDRDNCFLYELYETTVASNGAVSAASGAVWDLLNNNARPYKWTSADAAGLPIFPGLARYDEVAAGAINHALRFTLHSTKAAIVPPAKHVAPTSTNAYAAPMGMRMRLRANFDISGFSPQAKVILTALKTYGMILADNGSSMYISGAPSSGWNNTDLHSLTGVTAADFEVLQETPLYTGANIPTGPAPKINSFTAVKVPGATTHATTAAMELIWNATGASYYVISPGVGAVRGSSVSERKITSAGHMIAWIQTGIHSSSVSTATITKPNTCATMSMVM